MDSSCSKQDHGNMIIELQRTRTTKSREKTHQDHIADRGQVSMSHYNMVHKPISIKKAVNTPAGKVAMDRDRGSVEKSSPCGMTIDATVHLVDRTLPQLRTPQIILDSSATITLNILHPPHISESVLDPQNVELQRKSRSYSSFYEEKDFARVVASSRHITRFGEGSIAQSCAYT